MTPMTLEEYKTILEIMHKVLVLRADFKQINPNSKVQDALREAVERMQCVLNSSWEDD